MNHHEVRQMIKDKQLQDMVDQHRALSKTLAYVGFALLLWAGFTLLGALCPKHLLRPKKWYARVMDLIRLWLCGLAFLVIFANIDEM